METLSVRPSLRVLGKIRDLDESNDDGESLYEEVAKLFGLADAVVALIDIMERFPEKEWCQRYMETTGQTDRPDRQFRRNRHKAAEMLACRKTPDERPDVRLVVPELPTPPSSAPSETTDPDSGHSDTGNPLPGFPDMSERLRWWNPENN